MGLWLNGCMVKWLIAGVLGDFCPKRLCVVVSTGRCPVPEYSALSGQKGVLAVFAQNAASCFGLQIRDSLVRDCKSRTALVEWLIVDWAF
jgi:hypothetical protein